MKRQRLTDREVLRVLRKKLYTVDLTTGAVTRTKTGRVVTPFVKKGGRKLIRLYAGGKVKALHLAKLVWMAGTSRTVPKDFEVHHFDEMNDNDGFDNLLCLHKLDHRKFHKHQEVYAEDIPY